MSQEFTSEQLKIVKRKEVNPDDYTDSFEKFSEDKVPDRSKFYSSSKDECINEKDYLHVVNVWNTFKRKTMGDYHDLYLKADVSQLADVFENFVNTYLEYYELDLCHYFNSPGLSWDAMLKMTEMEQKLISDSDMYLFTEKRMRGGISYIAKRFSKAISKYMQSHDNSKPS